MMDGLGTRTRDKNTIYLAMNWWEIQFVLFLLLQYINLEMDKSGSVVFVITRIYVLDRTYIVKAKVCVYSPAGTADFTLFTPGVGTHSFTVSFPMVEYSTFSAAAAIHSHSINCRST